MNLIIVVQLRAYSNDQQFGLLLANIWQAWEICSGRVCFVPPSV